MSSTPKKVAEWMQAKLTSDGGALYQEQAAFEISEKFGEEFIYYNNNGNPAIIKEVLAEFRKLTEDTVVWIRSERYWRLREDGDEPGRLAEY